MKQKLLWQQPGNFEVSKADKEVLASISVSNANVQSAAGILKTAKLDWRK
jgi:hypothetical protein